MSTNVLEASVDAAHRFWANSPQATAFNEPGLIEKFVSKVTWWMAFKGDTPVLLWPLTQDDERRSVLPPFSYFVGPMWSQQAWGRSSTSKLSDSLTFYKAILERLCQTQNELTFELHPTLLDVRFFDWWGSEDKSLKPFEILPRYTAQIQNLRTRDMSEITASFRGVRRREINKAAKSHSFEITASVPSRAFGDLREKAIERQGATVETAEKRAMSELFELVEKGNGYCLGVVDRMSGDIAAATLVLDGAGISNLVLSAVDHNYRNHGAGPLAIYSSIEQAKERGSMTFDFNGANSPRRGDDKHSYGAESVLYFRLSNADSRA